MNVPKWQTFEVKWKQKVVNKDNKSEWYCLYIVQVPYRLYLRYISSINTLNSSLRIDLVLFQ